MRFMHAAAAAMLLILPGAAQADDQQRISVPVTHQNLSIYFVHGPSAPGPVPLTLQEALAKGSVEVIETKSVNELKVRNKGNTEVFIQSGEIVKGGQQDRVVTVSFLLPPKSGAVPLAAFCVESGRWAARGKEDSAKFTSSAEAMPSRAAKLAMKAPIKAAEAEPANNAGNQQNAPTQQRALSNNHNGLNETSERQSKVWNEVANVQNKLAKGLKAPVASAVSNTSLQLSLENEKLKETRNAYIAALEKAGTEGDDIIGYVFAVNGHINSADVYPSNGLFRKMWGKLLAASVTEAIGEKDETAAAPTPPDVAAVKEFLAAAEKPQAASQDIAGIAKQEVRDADASLFVGARTAKGEWVHRNYLVK
jgi:hypothetical protein